MSPFVSRHYIHAGTKYPVDNATLCCADSNASIIQHTVAEDDRNLNTDGAAEMATVASIAQVSRYKFCGSSDFCSAWVSKRRGPAATVTGGISS